MNADKIAAAIALIATLLSASGVPARLGLTPQWVTAIGGLVLACAGVIRGLLARHEGERVDWRDLLGAALGVCAIGLGLDGAAVDQLDPDMLAGAGSFAAMLFAAHRGSSTGGGTTGAGLVLLVMVGCNPWGATMWAISVGVVLLGAMTFVAGAKRGP